jgi:hypothetical protein
MTQKVSIPIREVRGFLKTAHLKHTEKDSGRVRLASTIHAQTGLDLFDSPFRFIDL